MLWSHLFGDQVGAYFQGHMERHGVRVLTGQKTLPDGDYDMILAGIGVSPNIELAQNAGLPTNQGVLADDHLVAAPDIWVAGDIAEYQSVIHDRRIRIEHWDVALNHGSYIGKSWAGAEDGPYQVVPYFFSDIGDWTWMEYVGPGNRDDAVEVRGSMDDDDFVAYYSDADGKLTACLAVNRGDELNAARELIASGGGVPARRAAELDGGDRGGRGVQVRRDLLDGDHRQVVAPAEGLQLHAAGHRPVGVHHLAQHPAGSQAGQAGEIDRGLGLAAPLQHAVGARPQREDVAGPHEIRRGRCRGRSRPGWCGRGRRPRCRW